MPADDGSVCRGRFEHYRCPTDCRFYWAWYLVSAALEENEWFIAGLVLLGSLFAVVYIGRILEAAYFKKADLSASNVKEAPVLMLIPMWILC